MPQFTQYEESLRREVATLKHKATHAHKLACFAVDHAQGHLKIAQTSLEIAEDIMRATAEATNANPI